MSTPNRPFLFFSDARCDSLRVLLEVGRMLIRGKRRRLRLRDIKTLSGAAPTQFYWTIARRHRNAPKWNQDRRKRWRENVGCFSGWRVVLGYLGGRREKICYFDGWREYIGYFYCRHDNVGYFGVWLQNIGCFLWIIIVMNIDRPNRR